MGEDNVAAARARVLQGMCHEAACPTCGPMVLAVDELIAEVRSQRDERVDSLERLIHEGLRTLGGAVEANTETLAMMIRARRPVEVPDGPH